MSERIIINSNDIANLYGFSIRSAQRRLKKAKKALNKIDGITIKEYSDYYHLSIDEILSTLSK